MHPTKQTLFGDKVTITITALMLLFGLTACSSAGGLLSKKDPAPPTRAEQWLFDTVTNMVPRVASVTNVVTVTRTNWVDETNYITFQAHTTNVVTLTNLVPVTQLVPGAGAETITQVGGAVAAPFGWGGVVALILGGISATYLTWRNRALSGQVTAGQAVSATLAQNIEVLRRMIETTPQGAQLGALAKQYLIENQAKAGVIDKISGIVANVVDDKSAKAAAEEFRRLLAQVSK